MKFQFIDISQDQPEYFHVYQSNDGVNIGLYPVMFGWRVRVWKTGSMSCEHDLCCGAEMLSIKMVFLAVLNFLEKGGALWEIPRQLRKPYPQQNEQFTRWVNRQWTSNEQPHTSLCLSMHDLILYKRQSVDNIIQKQSSG